MTVPITSSRVHSGDAAVDFVNRRFQIWDYVVSMNKLLIRSPKRESERNIDLKFFGVKYLRLGTSFDGLSVSESPVWPFDGQAPVDLTAATIYLLTVKYRVDVIVANQLIIEENDLDIMTSSLGRS
jgi:hypothetical protein